MNMVKNIRDYKHVLDTEMRISKGLAAKPWLLMLLRRKEQENLSTFETTE